MLSCLLWLKCWVKFRNRNVVSIRYCCETRSQVLLAGYGRVVFILQFSTVSEKARSWSQKPRTDLRLFAFQGREGRRVNSTFWCLWSYFNHCRNKESKFCAPPSPIIIHALLLLLQGKYYLWKNATCWRLINRNTPSSWTVLLSFWNVLLP